MKGMLFNIQRFCTGDGPGIRTTVFFKGCPLLCKWCHNPESQSSLMQLCYYRQKCIQCGRCAAVCSNTVFTSRKNGNLIDYTRCNLCGKCIGGCPGDALELIGREYDAEEVVQNALRDRAYYGENGGVTLSGGEPCVQWQFALRILQRLKSEKIHTALDTCGACQWEHVKPLLPYVDLVLFDLKHMDSLKHKTMTGAGNEQILQNFKHIWSSGKRILVRIPMIPGYNDNEENLNATAAFLGRYPAAEVELLPYDVYGVPKYEALGKTYEMDGWMSPDQNVMQKYRSLLRERGLQCR